MIDFERTATGVLRIETTVRFAARSLRQCGLLQYTSQEAFKTWRLSLLGILAADNVRFSHEAECHQGPFVLFTEKVLEQLNPLQTLPDLITT